ncbi:MAG: NAD(P)/FAD-dependent oxidoreductase [Clostridiales bacterium]|nr:NAD(P)/FAD-dependent oxidoreductase [Clostridiales bacterium]
MSRVAVIGGGAAGMMAACTAGAAGCEVTLFEHNEKTGKKLFITGKGRCNLTNACDTEDFFRSVLRNHKFLYSAVYQFDSRAVMDFFEANGLRLKTERGNRVFPQSDHASDVIKTLEKAMHRAGVRVILQANVTDIRTEDGRVAGVVWEESGAAGRGGLQAPLQAGRNAEAGIRARTCSAEICVSPSGQKSTVKHPAHWFPCDAVIMATGGISYPTTGSDGSGWEILRRLGHTCTALRPALVGMRTKEGYIPELQGLSLRNISFALKAGEKKIFEEFGELLFTHQGISGPVVLTASSVIPDKYFREPDEAAADRSALPPAHLPSGGCLQRELTFEIDLKPSLSEAQLDLRIQRDFAENANRQYKNALGRLLPAKLIPVVIRLSGIDPGKKTNSVTREERRRLLALLKHFPGTVTGLCGWQEAIITRGGIRVAEVNPSTMESKLVAGLYLCGEMLDLDAATGGYNLQIAWATGHLAGESVK